MRRGLIALGCLVALAAPASAQWAIQRVDQYNMVVTNPREAVLTLAYVDGMGGWRLQVACAPGGQWVLLLGRANLFAPPAGGTIRLAVVVAGRGAERLFNGEVPMQWVRGGYEGVMPASLAAALAQGEHVSVVGAPG